MIFRLFVEKALHALPFTSETACAILTDQCLRSKCGADSPQLYAYFQLFSEESAPLCNQVPLCGAVCLTGINPRMLENNMLREQAI